MPYIDYPRHVVWLVMDYDLGYFDLETRVLEPLENPLGPKVLPI
jgi:putative transposase